MMVFFGKKRTIKAWMDDEAKLAGEKIAFSALTCLQCFDTVGWAAGRAPSL